MGERKNGPLGLQLHIDGRFAPGFPQDGLPLRLVLPGPIGTPEWLRGAGKARSKDKSARSAAAPSSALEKFKRALMDMQVHDREKHHKKAILGIDKVDRRPILGGKDKELHKDVAPHFNAMWKEIEAEHEKRTDGAKGDSVGVASAYRSAEDDERAWQRAFPIYYKNTLADRLETGDEFGKESLRIIFRHMNGKKAPPGFSGHTHGIAADLTTTEKGNTWSVISKHEHQVGWQKTWLYRWLVTNASKHDFYQLKTETWHWEYHADDPPSQCWGGDVKERPVPKGK